MTKNKAIFEDMPVSQAVWKLAIPTILAMLVTIIYNLADTFFIGQTGDTAQVAAVSLAMPIFMLLMAFGNLFGIGGSTAISRNLGSGMTQRVKHFSAFAFYGALSVGVIVAAILLIFMPQVVNLVGSSETTAEYVRQYLTYIAIGAPFIIVSNAFGNILRSEGSANSAMVGMMIGTITNIVLDPIMILVLDMGIQGAAIATVIGNVAATIYYIIYFKRADTAMSIHPRNFKINGGIASEVFSIGVPGALNNMLMSFSNIIYNNYLANYGDTAVAAMNVAIKVNMLLPMLLIGLAMGAQPLIAYSFGARNFQRMKDSVLYCMKVSVVIGVIVTVLYELGAPSIVKAFIDNAEVIEIGTRMLRTLMVSGPILGIMFVTMIFTQAVGKAGTSLILSLCRQGLVFIPTIIIASAIFGLNGLICAQPLADIFSVVLSVIIFIRITRKLENDMGIEQEVSPEPEYDISLEQDASTELA